MILGATLASATMLAAAPATAQAYDPNYPVCLRVYQSFVDFYNECAYTSIAQCAASASGRNAECIVNPFYGHALPRPHRRIHRRHHHAH